MRALRALAPDGPLEVGDAPTPTPGTGDVLIEVHAAAYTPGELTWPSTWVDRSGHDRAPSIPCHEVSGVVVAHGWGTTSPAVGEEVFALTDWYRDGAAAEYVAVEARNVARKPSSAGHREAATIPLAGLTAWQGLFEHGDLRPGQTVLITGAGGGVGTYAVQLAHAAGARVIGVGRRGEAELVTGIGADLFVEPDGVRVSEVGHVALVLDLVGGPLLAQSLSVREPGAIVVSIAEPHPEARYFVVEPDRLQLHELSARVDAGELRPVVGAACVLADAPAAVDAKHARTTRGKLVIGVRG